MDDQQQLLPPRPGRPPARGGELETQARIERIFELRKAGRSFAEIARNLGYSDESGPRKLYFRALQERQTESVDDLRQLLSARFDDMLKAIWVRVKQGELGAIDRALKIEEQRARLLGINMPAALVVDFDFNTWTPEQIQYWLRTRQLPPDIAAGGQAGEIIDADWESDPMAPSWDRHGGGGDQNE